MWQNPGVLRDDRPPHAPARSKELLDKWVKEFISRTAAADLDAEVVAQDGSDGRDTGLVVVRLHHGSAEVYMQPITLDSTEWETTLTARPDELTLSPYQLAALASEVAVASSLCSFLQFKSLEWDRMRGMH